jgi:hypothetical protein
MTFDHRRICTVYFNSPRGLYPGNDGKFAVRSRPLRLECFLTIYGGKGRGRNISA